MFFKLNNSNAERLEIEWAQTHRNEVVFPVPSLTLQRCGLLVLALFRLGQNNERYFSTGVLRGWWLRLSR